MNKKLFFFLSALAVCVTANAQNAGDFITRFDSTGGVQTLIITGYVGRAQDIVVPAYIGNLCVKVIGERAFELKNLTSVVISEGIERISKRAFYGNKIVRLELPSSIRIIGDAAFDNNVLLKVINAKTKSSYQRPVVYTQTVLPSKVSFVRLPVQTDMNFTENHGSPEVSLQQNFYSPVNINLNLNSNNAQNNNDIGNVYAETIIAKPEQDRRSPSNARVFVLSKTNEGLIALTGYTGFQNAVSIPNSIGTHEIRVIGKTAFLRKNLVYVNIPEGITAIGDGAFLFNNLKEVIIPSSVKYIGKQAFVGNTLNSVTIGPDVTMETDSFSYRFFDYYKMNDSRAGTYIFKSGQWDFNGVERVNYGLIVRHR